MKTICAWCKRDLGGEGSEEKPEISHGICPACREVLLAESREAVGILTPSRWRREREEFREKKSREVEGELLIGRKRGRMEK